MVVDKLKRRRVRWDLWPLSKLGIVFELTHLDTCAEKVEQLEKDKKAPQWSLLLV
jgi:hypothetical protein